MNEQATQNGGNGGLGEKEINWKQIAQQSMSEFWTLRQAADKMALAIQAGGWPEQSKAMNEYKKLRDDG